MPPNPRPERQILHLGIIGLGVMGEPICRNLVAKSRLPLVAFDLMPEALQRMSDAGASIAASAADVAANSDIVFLCLPSAAHVAHVCDSGLIAAIGPGTIVVDLGTTSVRATRDFAAQMLGRDAHWIDAPIARTRQAAQDGTLSVMVGATPELYERIEPLIRCFATDITLCGPTGAGQITKILNNMVLFQTVNALAEAVAVARRSNVDPARLLETLSKGSADSFALRNHGLKAIVPRAFPDRAFSTDYARKDLSYALELAADAGLTLDGANLTAQLLDAASAAGDGDAYFPVIARRFDPPEPIVTEANQSAPVPAASFQP